MAKDDIQLPNESRRRDPRLPQLPPNPVTLRPVTAKPSTADDRKVTAARRISKTFRSLLGGGR